MTNHTLIIPALYQIGAIQFGQFTLKSGQISSIYVNLRKIISHPILLKQIAQAIWAVVDPSAFGLICGVPYTALPIATCLSLQKNIPMVMRRKEKKEYGTHQTIEGDFIANQTCLVIEDVITTGSSIFETALELEKVGIHVKDVAALIDREEGGSKNLSVKYSVHTVFTLSYMLKALLDAKVLSNAERIIIKNFLNEHTL